MDEEVKNNGPKIYLLPNLMTAGNLFCGFAAVLRIFEGMMAAKEGQIEVIFYYDAIAFILGACVFDVLDGRVARFGGFESPFGREFDSLADIVSFGMAPALLVYQIVLAGFDWGWLIAFFYLLCGGLRLARFNCVAAMEEGKPAKDFDGFPIPAAAGLISSLTLFMIWMNDGARDLGNWKYALPLLLVFLSFMMFSHVKYPSFKAINLRTQHSIPKFLIIVVVLVFAGINYRWMPAVLFVIFLIYGFVRPFISRALRREIEEEDDEDEPEPPPTVA